MKRHLDRRAFLRYALTTLVVSGGGLGLVLPRRRRLFRLAAPVMGTVGEFQVVHDDPVRARTALQAALAEVRRVEALMTRFRPESDVGRANRGAWLAPVPVRRETAGVVARGLRWARLTAGRFDPALGRLTARWRDVSPAAAAQYAGRRLFTEVEVLNEGGSALRYGSAAVALDLGGIAKGYGADRAAAVLREAGIQEGLVNLGGDLVVLGRRGRPWRVGIRDPGDPRRVARVLELRNTAVATSGNTEHRVVRGGRIRHHLLDPRTGGPGPTAPRSVTVVAPSAMDADALATAFFFYDEAETRRFLGAHTEGVWTVRLG